MFFCGENEGRGVAAGGRAPGKARPEGRFSGGIKRRASGQSKAHKEVDIPVKKICIGLLAALCLLWPMGGAAQTLTDAAQEGTLPVLPDFMGPIPRGIAQEAWAPVPAQLDEEEAAPQQADEPAESDPAQDEPVEGEPIKDDPAEDAQAEDAPVLAQPASVQDTDLTLRIETAQGRLDEGQTLTVTVIAGNPLPSDTPVTLTLALPERLTSAQPTTWQAVLPAAKTDESGNMIPSEIAFTREVTLAMGGEGEQATLQVEMGMGARFYRAQTAIELCVSDVRVTAAAEGVTDGRVQPGDAFAYRVEIVNAGAASRDVPLELILPDGLSLAGELPEGFVLSGRSVNGTVRAEAADRIGSALVPSQAAVTVPVQVDADALKDDADALRLLCGVLRADGERLAMPRVQVCGAQITARLIPEMDNLEAGAQMNLRIVVANTGLAPADVRVSCVLPQGLTLVKGADNDEATPGESAKVFPPEDGDLQAAAMLTEEAEMPVLEASLDGGTLIYALHMDGARETADGIAASTRVIDVRVQAEEPQRAIRESLVGTALAWSTDDETRLAEAVAVRVYTPAFMGITMDEWGGIFWATLLLVVTVACLYAAVRVDKDDDYCFD